MKEYGIVEENVDLKKYNTYGIGGFAKYLVRPNSVLDLKNLIDYLNQNKIKWFLLGNGSNVILPDEDYDGVIIKLDNLKNIEYKENECIVESGVLLNYLVNDTLKKGYINLAFLIGVPGSLGGAIISNAGCFGEEVFDFVKEITILDNQEIKVLQKEDIDYGYRYTEFKNKDIIVLKVVLNIYKGNVEKARVNVYELMTKRKNMQPLEYKNAGSVFKNPKDVSAGKLIEDAGLKGKIVGGAKVSEKHANFIVNFNNATSHDIISLIDIVKQEVKNQYDIDLELEQKIVNW